MVSYACLASNVSSSDPNLIMDDPTLTLHSVLGYWQRDCKELNADV